MQGATSTSSATRRAALPALRRCEQLSAGACEFMEEEEKTRLPCTVMLTDERKLFELHFCTTLTGSNAVFNSFHHSLYKLCVAIS